MLNQLTKNKNFGTYAGIGCGLFFKKCQGKNKKIVLKCPFLKKVNYAKNSSYNSASIHKNKYLVVVSKIWKKTFFESRKNFKRHMFQYFSFDNLLISIAYPPKFELYLICLFESFYLKLFLILNMLTFRSHSFRGYNHFCCCC